MQSGPSWALILAAAVTFGGCQSGPSSDEIATSLRELLTNGPTSTMGAAVWADVQDAYNRRDSSPLWVSIGQAKAREALAVLRTAGDHGFQAADYRDEEIAGRLDTLERDEEAQDRVGELARLDVLVTSALLDLGRDVALGRTTPERIDRRWKARREPPDLVATLEQAAESNLGTWLDAIRPRHPEYVALQRELKRLRGQPSHGGSPNVPEGTNLSVAARIKLVELNLERWRWLPDDLGSQHVLVNLPSYSLAARENGRTALTMRVVVGTPEHATPVFSGPAIPTF